MNLISMEVLQDVGFTGNSVAVLRVLPVFDTNADFVEVIAYCISDRADTVVNFRTFLRNFELAKGNIEVVVQDKSVRGVDFEELHDALERLAGAVHKGLGL